jgi:hypothetical protein
VTSRARLRARARLLGGFFALVAALLLAPAAGAAAPLSIGVAGNHFVDGAGQTIRLLGVDHPSFEYACQQGWGYSDGHMNGADAAAVAAWNANAVRVPLNEDCWLGINGEPSESQGEHLTVAGYRAAVASYVAALNAAGLYAILDLHWSAPAGMVADGQQPMPDEHSPAFWSSVASTFRTDPAVVFDVFNEPFSPADPRSGDDPKHPVSWACWRDGGCTVPAYENSGTRTRTTYPAVGMQALVTAIRKAGATQPLLIGGLDYANDLTGWLADAPADPLSQEAADFHDYQGKTCDDVPCWNSQIAPVAASVPVVTGEFDEEVCSPDGFDSEYMSWADAHGIGYLAWGWWVLSPAEISAAGCSAFYLLSSYGGTAAAPNGTSVRTHLLSLPPGGVTLGASPGAPGGAAGSGGGKGGGAKDKSPIRLTKFSARVEQGGAKVAFTLTAAEACRGILQGQTVKSYALAGHKRRPVGLGTARFRVAAGRSKTVVLALPRAARQLLAARGSLRARFTLELTNARDAPTVVHRLATLKRRPLR